MTSREVREDQHGTTTGYMYGCRCGLCREARSDAHRSYYEANRTLILEKAKAYREANPERVAEIRRAYDRANRTRNNARYRARYWADPERSRAANRAYDRANREYRRAASRESNAKLQAESLSSAPARGARWQPHEDALLYRIPSNIAAASALGRTYASVSVRRARLARQAVS